MNLFGPAPIEAKETARLGMRPGTVGDVAYVQLSLDAASSLRALSGLPRLLRITLPGGKSVICELKSETRPDGLIVSSGTTVGGEPGGRCDLVVDNGQVTGDIDIATGRYRIVPLGSGTAHAVVEVRTEAFPDEQGRTAPES